MERKREGEKKCPKGTDKVLIRLLSKDGTNRCRGYKKQACK